MNKEYIYNNGKCIVIDEEGNKKEVKYSKNLEEILILENQVEELERILNQTNIEEKYNNEFLEDSKNKGFRTIVSSMVISFIIIFVLMCFGQMSIASVAIPDTLLINMFGNVSVGMFLSIVTGSIIMFFGGLSSLFSYFDHREAKRNQSAFTVTKINLQKKLALLNEKINELKNASVKEEQEVVISKKINDKELLDDLRGYLQVCFDCGYNEQRFNKYFQKGVLTKKLGNVYTEEGLTIIEEHLKKQEKNLVKKRVKR